MQKSFNARYIQTRVILVEMRFYICAKEGPNKGSSFSTKLVREIYNFYNGDNSKIIFYGGIEL